jgi:NitT/TauT family transport system ATP-binding protein
VVSELLDRQEELEAILLDKLARQGIRIVSDYALPKVAQSTLVKTTAEFGELIQQIRQEGFNPKYLRHASSFDLAHPHSFQTLCAEEK